MADHWAFLEEIEAPMWADLNLEPRANDLDVDDDWFYRNHHFHQCSARQLKSTIFHPAKGSKVADFNFPKASSPKVPSSVSRSRGKDYRSRKWREAFMLGDRHPVKDLTACVNSGSSEATTLKSSITSVKGSSTSKTRMVRQGNSSSSEKPVSAYGYSGSSSSVVNNMDEGNTSSVVTSESIQQGHPKEVKFKNHGFGTTSEHLMVTGASFRKSFTTRQAIRVEVKNTGRQTESKSLSGKSSVGSSSNPPSCGRTSTARSIQKKEGMLACRNVLRVTQSAKNKTSIQSDKKDLNSKGNKFTGKKPISLEVTRLKNEKLSGRVPLNVKVNKRKSVTAAANGATELKEKARPCKLKALADSGKQNVRGKTIVSQKCSVIAAGTTSTFQRESKQNSYALNTTCSRGKIREVTREKNLLNQRLYFR